MMEEQIPQNPGGYRQDNANMRYTNRQQTKTYNVNYNVHVAGGFTQEEQYKQVDKNYGHHEQHGGAYQQQRSSIPHDRFKTNQK